MPKALFLSDFHIGHSQAHFSLLRNIASYINREHIEHVLFIGDLIDGSCKRGGENKESQGIYDRQLEKVNLFLSHINKKTNVWMIPGNHDTYNQLRTLESGNVAVYRSPADIFLYGKKILLYHGEGLALFCRSIGIPTNKPTEVMQYVLQRMYLRPDIAQRPTHQREKRYELHIQPNIFAMGHFHRADIETWDGSLLLSTGTLLEETRRQIFLGITPTVGVFPLYNFETEVAQLIDFSNNMKHLRSVKISC